MNQLSEPFCGEFLRVQPIVHGQGGGEVGEHNGEPEIGQQMQVSVLGLISGCRVEDCEDHEDGHQADLEGLPGL